MNSILVALTVCAAERTEAQSRFEDVAGSRFEVVAGHLLLEVRWV